MFSRTFINTVEVEKLLGEEKTIFIQSQRSEKRDKGLKYNSSNVYRVTRINFSGSKQMLQGSG